MKKITLRESVRFHGHLGPYLVLGVLAGELAVKKLGCARFFGLKVKVYGAGKKPKSCLIDGLQLSTGATYGKGNIQKLNGPAIKMEFIRSSDNKSLSLELRGGLIKRLEELKTHADSEAFARQLYHAGYSGIFK